MTIILTSDELEGVSGYRSSKRQLAELHRQGFYRARIGATGNTPALEKRIGVASTSPIYPMRLTPPPNHQRMRNEFH